MKKSLAQLMKTEIATLEKGEMLNICGGAVATSSTKEWRTVHDNQASTTDTSLDSDASAW